MKNDEIKQAVEEYFNQMLAKDADYLDHVTDSWIFDAEDWFKLRFSIVDWNAEEIHWFCKFANDRFTELYGEKYGERDAKHCLHRISNDVKTLLEKYNSVKHHFKKFNAYTEVVAHQFGELEKYLQLLDDIESGKVEFLKEKGDVL